MLQSRSAVLTMLQTHAKEDRRITDWPPPFSRAMTPYTELDFDSSVRQACAASAKILRVSKVIVLGDLAVGKTSLVRRFCHNSYNTCYKPTIGVDFELERFDILGVPFNLQIWDTAGQERFKAIAASYYRSASAIMIVFDLGNMNSLSHCPQWLKEAEKCNSNGSYFIFLVGTKRDVMDRQVYGFVEGRARAIAREIGGEYWAVSARMDNGVRDLFLRVAAVCFNAAMSREIKQNVEKIHIGSNLINIKRQEHQKKDSNFSKWLKCAG